MKKLALLLVLGFMLVGCNNPFTKDDTSSVSGSTAFQEKEDTSQTKVPLVDGKKTIIALMMTTCAHCNNQIPILDTFYRDHKDDVTMQVIVTDAKSNGKSKFAGNYQIPQETNPEKVEQLSYQALTGEACGYVPSFVIFSPDNQIEEKICGGSLTYEELEEKLLFEKKDEISSLQKSGWEKDDLGVVITTNHGKIEIKLFPKEAPKTVENFLALAEKGYYDGLTFHRVIKDFMIQGGDPNGNGTGGESIYGGKFKDEFHPELKNFPGSLAMANSGPATNGSQFFINQVRNTHLDNKHSVFGQVVAGMEVVNAITEQAVDTMNQPLEPVIMEKVEVVQYDGENLKPFVYDFERRQTSKKSKIVQDGDTVSVHYLLTTTDSDEVVENSRDAGMPLEFVVSDNAGLLPAFVEGVKGMKIGDKKNIEIPAKDSYGEATMEIPRKDLEDAMAQGGDTTKIEKGAVIFDTEILDVTNTTVTIANNHPLAGKTLKFELELMDIE